MGNTDPTIVSSTPTNSNIQNLKQTRQEGLRELLGIVRELFRNDATIKEMGRLEGLTEEEVLEQANVMLADSSSDEISELQGRLKSAQEIRHSLLKKRDPWYSVASIVVASTGGVGLLILLAVSIAKWTGHLLLWPLWPLVAFPCLLFFGGIIAFVSLEPDDSPAASATLAAERLKSNLDDAVRSLVVIPAIEKLASLRLVAPSEDIVQLTEAPSLSSRIESGGRIQTGSYRDVFTCLQLDGGATIGLAGSRGVGKSELLAAFCNDPDERPSLEGGGTIGVIVPAPVAYEAQSFLRILIRGLAEAVPGYADHVNHRIQIISGTNFVILALAAVSLAFGISLNPGWVKASHHTIGLALISFAGLMVLVWVMRMLLSSRAHDIITFLIELLLLFARFLFVPDLPFGGWKTTDLEKFITGVIRIFRQRIAAEAANSVRRVSYIEKLSTTSESSAAWKNFGFKQSSGIGLDQVPLAEPDLVAELQKLVKTLYRGGYQVRIGVDELDKLSSGAEAERFLTGIKVLFSIRNCSFLLTISENAAAQFARRGMPIRDVFDSSLDTVIVVRPLNFYEARRLIRTRLSAGQSDRISDSQVLLCHYLSGGLPRDLLRSCRQLGEINSRSEGTSTLQNLMDDLLNSEVSARIDAVSFSLQSRETGESSTAFVAELDRLRQAVERKEAFEMLEWFLSTDASFARLSRDLNIAGGELNTFYLENKPEHENWIQDSRRQLYSFIYFVETVRQTFECIDVLNFNTSGATERSDRIELLADARRRLEMDAASGWRRTTEARLKFGLVLPCASRPSSQEGVCQRLAALVRRRSR
jgi:hypothetical protein